MKTKIIVLLTFLSYIAIAQTTASSTDKKEDKKRKFYVHSGEFHITPGTDYFIYAKGKLSELPEPYNNTMPFFGFNIGGRYMFRPVHVVAVSGGLAFRMQGYFNQTKDAPLGGDLYISSRSYGHRGFISIPVYVHLFKRMKNCTFEFATGPEFHIPIFVTRFDKTYNPVGETTNSNSEIKAVTSDFRKQFSSFGWSIYLGGQVELSDKADMFIGPQIAFFNLAQFDKAQRLTRTDNGGNYDIFLGLKMGFRFHR